MNDGKLIEIIRGYPVLYDASHSKYMDISYKLSIWNKIGKDMKESVTSCKTRWYNMRDNFRKSLRRSATLSGHSSKKMKQYKYSAQLGFLKRYFKERDSTGNLKSQKEEEEEEEDTEEYEYVEVITAHEDDEFVPLSPVPTHENSSEAPRKLATQRRAAPQSNTSSQLIEYGTLHPVDAFLSGIGVTLKSLPPYYLNLAKSEIFATVQKYELKMLVEDPSTEHRMMPWQYGNTSTLVSTPKMSPIEHQQE